jgi:hypothetical protein
MGFQRFEIMQFEFHQAMKLFQNVVVEPRLRDTLVEGLDHVQGQIAMTPLSLMLLIQVVKEHGEIPASITELYERFFDQVLGRFDKEKGIEVLFEYTVKRFFLGELAFSEFFEKDRLTIPKSEFQGFATEFASRYQWDQETFGSFIEELDRAGVLSIDEEVEFYHRSFLDYFAAFHVNRIREKVPNLEDFLISTYFSDLWPETVFFYVGMNRYIDGSMLERIFSYEADDFGAEVMKFLACRLLQSGWLSPDEVKRTAIKKAADKASVLQTGLLELLGNQDEPVPPIVADYFLFALSMKSLNSVFLLNPEKQVISELMTEPTYDNLRGVLAVLSGITHRLEPDEVENQIRQFLNVIDEPNKFTTEEQARLMWGLIILDSRETELRKALRRRLRLVLRRHASVRAKLLPTPPKSSSTLVRMSILNRRGDRS